MQLKLLALAACGALALSAPAFADTINFGQFGGDGTVISDGATGVTADGVGFSISGPNGGFTEYTQSSTWSGNFPDGTPVLFDGYGPGAITISFDSALTSFDKLGVEANAFGPYTAYLDVYDGMTLVGTDSFNAVSANAPNTIQSFSFSGHNFTSLVISTSNDGEGVGLGGAGGSGSYMPPSAAPEPGVWALMLGGVGILGGMLRVAQARRREDDAVGAAAA